MIFILLFVYVFLFHSPGNIFASNLNQNQKMKSIAVLEFGVQGLPAGIQKITQDIIEGTILNSNYFRIFLTNEIRVMLKKKKLQLTRNRKKNAFKIGKKIQVDYLVVGMVEKKEKIKISMWLLDIKKKQILVSDDISLVSLRNFHAISGKLSERFLEKILIFLDYKKENLFNQAKSLQIFFKSSYLGPRDDFKSMSSFGWGITPSLLFHHAFFKNIIFGFEPGYLNFQGNYPSMAKITISQALLSIGYRAIFLNRLQVISSVYLGAGLVRIMRSLDEFAPYDLPQETSNSAWESVGKWDCLAIFSISRNLRVLLGVGYQRIFEKNGAISFWVISAGAGSYF